jgi:hypothetical protein
VEFVQGKQIRSVSPSAFKNKRRAGSFEALAAKATAIRWDHYIKAALIDLCRAIADRLADLRRIAVRYVLGGPFIIDAGGGVELVSRRPRSIWITAQKKYYKWAIEFLLAAWVWPLEGCLVSKTRSAVQRLIKTAQISLQRDPLIAAGFNRRECFL